MPPVVTRLTARNIEQAIDRSTYVLVRLDHSPRPTFHRGLVEWFDQQFPNQFTFGTLTRAELKPHELDAMFRTALGAMRGGVKDGYHLFETGLIIAHHGGETRSESVQYSTDGQQLQDDAVIRDVARTSHRDADALRQLLTYFLPILERRQRAAGWTDSSFGRDPTPPPNSRTAEPPPRAAAPPPRTPSRAPPAADDPYVVLGVPSTATDEELKTAWKTQLRLNHPDKVAHLSPALQKFAEQQILALKAAYEAILVSRGKPRS